MKAPESALARRILNDPKKAASLIEAILSARVSSEGSAVSSDGKLRVTMTRKVAPVSEAEG